MNAEKSRLTADVPKIIKDEMLDLMASSKRYRSQSDFIQRAIEEKINRERE